MPGQLVDIGGHPLHQQCTGTGSPTVVLEPGAGAMSSDLGWITPAVARNTRVCVYDRAGRGWSESADTVQDGTQIATDLHTLLRRGHVPGPYVLAGHSFGGLYVLAFANRYPDEVAGLVLVDSTASSEPARPAVPLGTGDSLGRIPVLSSLTAHVGVARLLAGLNWGSLPAQSRDEVRVSNAQARWVASTVDEYSRGGASAHEAASLHDLGDKPLYVVTAGEHPASWMADQRTTLHLSTNSVQQVVGGATHVDVIIEEKYAAATTRAVLAVVSSVRNEQPLRR
jgi:pimeloyl-ACP methyl ester carboxylesterase